MPNTKECPNCGKRMIEWNVGQSVTTSPARIIVNWKCYCGCEEFCDLLPIVPLKTFNQAWREANKEADNDEVDKC